MYLSNEKGLVPITLWLWLITALLIIGCSGPPRVKHELQPHYFEQTEQSVQGDFLEAFHKFGGVDGLGLPLTGELIVDGWRVQYFEKGRLEYHPENEPAFRVTVGWLGDLMHRRRPPISPGAIPAANLPNHRYFPETGHTLSGDFLQYFDAQGGSVRFGLPISEPFIWQGRLSQDFQSGRMFWTPERRPPVVLENIGQVHLQQINKRNGGNTKVLPP